MVSFFFNDTATTEIYTLSLHDALPISRRCGGVRDLLAASGGDRGRGRRGRRPRRRGGAAGGAAVPGGARRRARDRKSTRLNSSHANISYAVFCLKKKNTSIFSSSFYII